jgi:phospholipid/cholesterol/gamma-HCH transport system permease protein
MSFASLRTMRKVAAFSNDLLITCVRTPPSPRSVLHEAYQIGVMSLPVLLVIAAFVGSNLAIQGNDAFEMLGGRQLVGIFVALAGVRELTPLLVAAMVAAKAGTQMASELAVMRIRHEVDAIEVMSLSPMRILVLPKLLGILLTLPALTIIAVFTMLLSAWLVATMQLGLDGHTFLFHAAAATSLADLAICGLKAATFGGIIVIVSCFFGLNSEPGAVGVGTTTNRAVVVCALLCAISNMFITWVLYS